MTRQVRVKGVKDTALIRVGFVFTVIGAIAEFAGIATLAGLVKGDQAGGILWIVAGLLVLAIAGYMFWGYWWIKAHSSEFKKRAEAAHGPGSWQEDEKKGSSLT